MKRSVEKDNLPHLYTQALHLIGAVCKNKEAKVYIEIVRRCLGEHSVSCQASVDDISQQLSLSRRDTVSALRMLSKVGVMTFSGNFAETFSIELPHCWNSDLNGLSLSYLESEGTQWVTEAA
ncbi:MAG: hypothetical protein INR68_08970 [Methylobacterium mesophilicum]|nr:hypothetical protein [Methylobacterium mesophilicum]